MENRSIMSAIRLANEAHEGQYRKWGHCRVPYIIHPLRVMNMVAVLPSSTENMVIAAIFHDVLEDTKFGEDVFLANGFGGEVLRLVKGVTNPSIGTGLSRSVRKAMDRKHVAEAAWGSRVIKLADRLDNLAELRTDPGVPRDFVEMYKGESRLLLDALKGTEARLEAELKEILK